MLPFLKFNRKPYVIQVDFHSISTYKMIVLNCYKYKNMQI